MIIDDRVIAALLTIAQALVYHKNSRQYPVSITDEKTVAEWYRAWMDKTSVNGL